MRAFATRLVLGMLGLAGSATAQITPITVPKGQLRWDFSGQLESWDWRWRDGHREEAAADFARASLDRAFVPGLSNSEANIRTLTGLAQVNLSLGRSIASEIVNRGTRAIGGAFGLTRSITVFGSVPIVSVKIEPRFVIDPTGATAGINPANNASFLGSLGTAMGTLQTRLPTITDPSLRALAQQILDRGAALESLLAQPFLPLAASAEGASVLQALQSMQADLATNFQIGFAGTPSLANGAVDLAAFSNYLTDPDGLIVGRPIDDTPYLIRMGDVEVGAAWAIVDRFPRSRMGSGFRATLDGTVRLRTAQLDRQDRFLDLGTGDRQPDVDLNLTTDFAFGRFGLRMSGGYNLQLPGNQNRRVSPPDQPIAPVTARAGVRRDPGDVVKVSARPFVRLATHLALFGGVDFWTRKADVFEYAAGQPPIEGVALDALAIGTKADALLLSGGLSYAHSGESKRGLLGLPMDANIQYQRIARSGAGIVPDVNSVRVDLRFYTRLWK